MWWWACYGVPSYGVRSTLFGARDSDELQRKQPDVVGDLSRRTRCGDCPLHVSRQSAVRLQASLQPAPSPCQCGRLWAGRWLSRRSRLRCESGLRLGRRQSLPSSVRRGSTCRGEEVQRPQCVRHEASELGKRFERVRLHQREVVHTGSSCRRSDKSLLEIGTTSSQDSHAESCGNRTRAGRIGQVMVALVR